MDTMRIGEPIKPMRGTHSNELLFFALASIACIIGIVFAAIYYGLQSGDTTSILRDAYHGEKHTTIYLTDHKGDTLSVVHSVETTYYIKGLTPEERKRVADLLK